MLRDAEAGNVLVCRDERKTALAAICRCRQDRRIMGSPFSGVLLAAGRSRRMGSDKALLDRDGAPLWQRQRAVLAAAGAREIFLSARPEQSWAAAAPGFAAVLHDAMPDGGPLVGITAAIERQSHPHLAVLAVDLPRLPAAWFAILLAKCGSGVGCVGRRGDRFEPLAAVYPREMKWLAWEHLARGEFALQPLIGAAIGQGRLQVTDVQPDQEAWFENWNEPGLPPAASASA